MCPGVVRTDRDHIDVVRCADLDREKRLRVDRLNPVEMLRVIFDRVGRVERERAEQADERDRAAELRYLLAGLGCQQVATESGLRALSVLELDNRGRLDGLLLDAEVTGRHLGDDALLDLVQLWRVATLAGGHQSVPVLGVPSP